VLPGHIWVSREELEVQNMKYLCPKVLQAIISETQQKIKEYQDIAAMDIGADIAAANKQRRDKDAKREEIEKLFRDQEPLKWVNRVIMWCADKMPSFAKGLPATSADDVVNKSLERNADIKANLERRAALIKEYLALYAKM